MTIIGAGIAGLTLAKHLRIKGIPFSGYEKEAREGGRATFGDQRFYSEEVKAFLSDSIPVSWVSIDEEAVQINKKGDFGPLTEGYSSPEAFYLDQPFWVPSVAYSEVVAKLQSQATNVFQLRSTVSKVDLVNRRLHFLNGSESEFSYLVWTSSFSGLMKLCEQTPSGLPKKSSNPLETGGLTWDIEIREHLFPQKNTVVFPFRYKDLKLRALGRAGISESKHPTYHWSLFLEDALLENREELAKIVRAFKRELGKQFPNLEKGFLKERLAFHPSLSGEAPISMPSLEVFEGVVCVGPDIQAGDSLSNKNDRPLRNLDRELKNSLDFLELILPKWLQKPAQRVDAVDEVTVSL